MSDAGFRLAARREALRRQAEAERAAFRAHAGQIAGTAARADRGIAWVRRYASPPLVAGVAALLAAALGKRGVRQLVAAGLTGWGLVSRLRGRRATGRT